LRGRAHPKKVTGVLKGKLKLFVVGYGKSIEEEKLEVSAKGRGEGTVGKGRGVHKPYQQ